MKTPAEGATPETRAVIAEMNRAYVERIGGYYSKEKRENDDRISLQRERNRLLEGLRLPALALEIVRGGRLTTTVALQAVRENKKPILGISGGPGTGKTVSAIDCICRRLDDPMNWNMEATLTPQFRGGRMLFVTATAIVRWDRYDAEEMERLLHPSLLIIDDMGVEPLDQKGFAASIFDEVVDARYSGRGTTIITTNLSAKSFERRYGVRVWDRLRERGAWFGVGDKSMRAQP